MAFLREAEDFLARLPSICLDGMDPLLPQSEPALSKSQYTEMLPTKVSSTGTPFSTSEDGVVARGYIFPLQVYPARIKCVTEFSGRFSVFAKTCPTAFLLHVAAEQSAKGGGESV